MTSDICGIDFKHRSATHGVGNMSVRRISSRGATSDGSRGFQPTAWACHGAIRRGATVDRGMVGKRYFKRRSATRDGFGLANRGLKPTATVMRSLCDRPARGASLDGSRAFQRPVMQAGDHARRGAAVEPSNRNRETAVLAEQIQENLEELGA